MFNRKTGLFTAACSLALILLGCGPGEVESSDTTEKDAKGQTMNEQNEAPATTTPIPGAAAGSVLATVNGQAITEQQYDSFFRMRRAQNPNLRGTSEERMALIKELVDRELAMQEAVKLGLDKNPNVAAALEFQRNNLLVTAALENYLNKHPITDEELKKEYDQRMAQWPSKEYKARHILLNSEEEAKAVIEELKKGGDFAKLADQKSADSNARKGGDLGWFSTSILERPFADAVEGLKKGEYSQTPVKTSFGWHVILLEDSRGTTAPGLDQVKDQLRLQVMARKSQEYVDGLKKDAKIEMKAMPQTTAPAASQPPAAPSAPSSVKTEQ